MKGRLEEKLDAKTYRHGFSNVGDIDVMMCNDSFREDKARREVDIVKMETVKQVLDEMWKDFPACPKITGYTLEMWKNEVDLWLLSWKGKHE